MGSPSFTRKKFELTKSYIERLPSEIKNLNTGWAQLNTSSWNWETFSTIRIYAHNLAGNCANFSVPQLGEVARQLDQKCHLIKQKGSISDEDKHAITSLLNDLSLCIIDIQSNPPALLHQDSSVKSSTNKSVTPTIAVLESNKQNAKTIEKMLKDKSYQVMIYDNHKALKEDIKNHNVQIILADVLADNCPLANAICIDDILSSSRLYSSAGADIILLAEPADFTSRLTALRAGIKTYITKPINPSELLKKIEESLEKQRAVRSKILIVDDDKLLTQYYEAALSNQGFIVSSLNQPLTLLEQIESFTPDLIILDYQMPACNGLEIAEILRGDSRTKDIPILFISANQYALSNKGLLQIVGNDFLEKPVNVDNLCHKIQEQLEKVERIQEAVKAITKRPETKRLANQSYFLHILEKCLHNIPSTRGSITHQCLLHINLNSIDKIKTRFAEFALNTLNNELENFFSEHPLIQGRGCKIGEFAYLLLAQSKAQFNNKKIIESFANDFNHQSFIINTDIVNTEDAAFTLAIGALFIDDNTPTHIDTILNKLKETNSCANKNPKDPIQIACFSPKKRQRKQPSKDIIEALNKRSFELIFQSIIKPESNDCLFEALVRLKDKNENIYSPESFIPFLEEHITDGHYILDQWVIENAFTTLETNSQRGTEEFAIIIKLFPDMKQAQRLLPLINTLVKNSKLQGSKRVYFSLVEEALIKEPKLALLFIETINKWGCGFIIDHCMVNNASLRLIKKIKAVDYIKLNPTLSRSMGVDPQAKLRVQKVQNAIDKQCAIIACAVEDAKTFAYFWDMNIRYFQGFFIHQPNASMLEARQEPMD